MWEGRTDWRLSINQATLSENDTTRMRRSTIWTPRLRNVNIIQNS